MTNVFVLCAGRCGSMTFAKSCVYIDNFSCAHESRTNFLGDERLRYPIKHIEVDNRLCWFLGRLDVSYGDDAFYVHLKRDRQAVAASFAKRAENKLSIVYAYRHSILLGNVQAETRDIMEDYVANVDLNIEHFLKAKSHKMLFRLENAREDFAMFFEKIGARGDLDSALAVWEKKYNAS